MYVIIDSQNLTFNIGGHNWKMRRRGAVFGTDFVNSLIDIFNNQSEVLVQALDRKSREANIVKIDPLVAQFAVGMAVGKPHTYRLYELN